jgi:NAD(P)-dependent dehydrogenase (short-subunit alcohol dehydrogenase family)
VVITGGATGIGWGISEAFAELGAELLIAQKTLREAEAGADKLARRGYVAHAVEADVGTSVGARALGQAAKGLLGRVDVLVNNAAASGIGVMQPFERFEDELLDTIIDVNLKGPFRCSREVLPQMRRGSTIVNISSVGAYAAQYHAAAYCASKSGLVMLTKALAIELAEKGVRVVGVAPGDIHTGRSRAAVQYWADQQPAEYSRINPIGRRGRPGDIAQAVVFLASEAASFVTGTTLVVDGGRLAY